MFTPRQRVDQYCLQRGQEGKFLYNTRTTHTHTPCQRAFLSKLHVFVLLHCPHVFQVHCGQRETKSYAHAVPRYTDSKNEYALQCSDNMSGQIADNTSSMGEGASTRFIAVGSPDGRNSTVVLVNHSISKSKYSDAMEVTLTSSTTITVSLCNFSSTLNPPAQLTQPHQASCTQFRHYCCLLGHESRPQV